MKIINVKIKNFKCITDLEANIEGKSILLVGKNGRGKSSFLQAVNLALGLDKNFPHNSVTKGKDEGSIQVLTGADGKKYEFTVKLREGKDPVLSLRTSDGLRTTEKGVIAGIVGAVPFDIFSFVELSRTKPGKRKQVELIKSYLPKETTDKLDELKARIEAKIEHRKQLKRDITAYSGFIAGAGIMESEIAQYASKINISELQDKHIMVTGIVARIEQRKMANIYAEGAIKDIDLQIQALREHQDSYREKIIENNKLNSEAAKFLSENKNPLELQQEINEASEHNIKFSKAQELKSKIKQLDKLQEELEDVDIFVKSSSSEIEEFVKSSPLPVEGLTFTDDAIFYNDIEVDEANLATSEIILLGAKLKMAKNPSAKVLTIERCESLDEDKVKELVEFARKYDFQLILESVDRTKEDLEIQIIPEYETIPQS